MKTISICRDNVNHKMFREGRGGRCECGAVLVEVEVADVIYHQLDSYSDYYVKRKAENQSLPSIKNKYSEIKGDVDFIGEVLRALESIENLRIKNYLDSSPVIDLYEKEELTKLKNRLVHVYHTLQSI